MSFGQSHRELVQDTNAGNIQPTTQERASSQAQIGSKQVRQVGVEDHALAAALVDVAGTAADPIIAETNRKKEEQSYINAGKEEGRKAANSAADVWHNKLFGADASLRGAQERIAEDNARNLYLEAQNLLENGGADSWDDETWDKWRTDKIAEEVGKYDSEGMKDHINTTMGKDFQKLERDRAWKHQEYTQAENRNTTLNGLDTIAKTFNSDMASSNVQRSEEDAATRLKEIDELKAKSGMSDKAFASVVAQTASNEYVKGHDDFAKYASENGYFDDLDFEDQQTLESAQRVHEMKHDAEFGDRSNAIYGPQGLIAQGNVTGALEAYDQLVADYPEAIPPGGRNQIRDQVRQNAWAHSERNRVQQERINMGMENARSGSWGVQVTYDSFGNQTGYSAFSEEEKLRFTQMYIADELENKEHANRLRDDPNYERTDITPEERNTMYADNTAFIGEAMQTAGVYLPEVNTLTSNAMSSINHSLADMTGLDAEQLKEQLVAINAISQGNPTVRQMMSEQMGSDFSKMEYVHKQLQAGKSPQEIEKALAEGKGAPPLTVASAKSAAQMGSPPEHLPSRSDAKEMYGNVTDQMKEGGFLFWGKATNKGDMQGLLNQYYSEELTRLGSTSDSAKEIAKGYATNRVQNEGSIISTGNGKEFVPGAGQFENELKERGYSGTDEYLKELGKNDVFMEDVRRASGQSLKTWNPFKNPLTSDGAMINALDDGRMQLIIPRDDGQEPYRRYLDLPPEEQVPIEVQQDADRSQQAMTIVDNPEQWTELTGRKQTPRQELDASLNKEIVKNDRPGGLNRTHRKLAEGDITQEQRDAHMPAHLYNDALIQRQQVEVDKVVRQQRARDKIRDTGRGSRARMIHERRQNKSTKPEEAVPDVSFYREGQDRNQLQENQKKQLETFYAKQAELRDLAVRERAEQ